MPPSTILRQPEDVTYDIHLRHVKIAFRFLFSSFFWKRSVIEETSSVSLLYEKKMPRVCTHLPTALI